METILYDMGFLKYRPGSGGSYEIYDIHVESEARRSGIGRVMVDRLIKACEREGIKRIYAITRAENRIAQEFYQSLNFIGIPLFNFYGIYDINSKRTVDAVMYLRDLEANP